MTMWVNEIENIKTMLNNCMSLKEIGDSYKVSKQRMYQILTKYGIESPEKKRKNYLRDKPPKYYWLARMLVTKKLSKTERMDILENINIPDTCPIFGLTLNYDGVEEPGWARTDSSPSIDRIDSDRGYTIDNIQIISWRANRIKNDSTPEELRKLADYMERLNKK